MQKETLGVSNESAKNSKKPQFFRLGQNYQGASSILSTDKAHLSPGKLTKFRQQIF
jgi:hypothetical protein